MDYIRADQKQYKANLHCHSTLSDGRLTPEQLVQAYCARGYRVLAITDHEAPYDHTALSTADILLLTGYEAYIRPSPQALMDPMGPEIHLNFFAKDPHNRTFIGYDPAFCKYMPHTEAEALPQAGPAGARQYTHEYINAFIAAARAAGYLVSYNHPGWSMEEEADILQYEGCFSLEVFNTGAQCISGCECNGALYDRMLRGRRHIYCHGADDNHNTRPFDDPLCDSFGSWTMLLAESLCYADIVKALERGTFYASTGPTITELSIGNGRAHLVCSPASRIRMTQSPKRTAVVYDKNGAAVTEAYFEIPASAPYVRFSVTDKDGKEAWTRGFFQEEIR